MQIDGKNYLAGVDTDTEGVVEAKKNSSLRLNRVIDMPEKTVVDQASGLKPPTAFAERGQGLPAAGVSTRRRQQADFRFDVGAGANALTFGRFQNAEGVIFPRFFFAPRHQTNRQDLFQLQAAEFHRFKLRSSINFGALCCGDLSPYKTITLCQDWLFEESRTAWHDLTRP